MMDARRSWLDDLHGSIADALGEGDRDRAEAACRRALAAHPTAPEAHVALANLLYVAGRTAEAMAAFHNALLFAPDDDVALAGLAAAARALGQADVAGRSASRALHAAPTNATARGVLGLLLHDRGDYEAAAREFLHALRAAPDEPTLHLALGSSLYYLYATVDRRCAGALADQWVREHAANPMAIHAADALLQRQPAPRADAAYIMTTFDHFAANFDRALAALDYRAPQLLEEAVSRTGAPQNASLDVLDIGCGTGLCGGWLRRYARHLTGVDLSPGMLAHARVRGCYDTLVEADLAAHLAAAPAGADLIVAADVLCYVGVLGDLLASALRALRPDGLLAFTVEQLASDTTVYELQPSGRYAHSRQGILATLAAVGANIIEVSDVQLRRELGAPVEGVLFVVGTPRE